MIRGCELVDRYGDELEYDFHAYLGLDLCDWFSGRGAPSWGKLIRMSMKLPSHGQFKAAILDDDDYAESVGLPDDSGDDKKRSIGYLEYDPTVQRLDTLADLLIALRATLIAVNSDKGKAPKDMKYSERPETAFDRLRKRHAREKRDMLIGILTPDQ